MAFTLFHGAIGYLFACLITKDKNLRRIGFIGGIIPDLDGLFLFTDFFFNTNYYPLFHRTLTHPILFGIFAAIITVIIMHKLFKTNKIKTFVVFLSGFLLHDAIDLLYNTTTTGWAIPLFAPLSTEKYSFPFIGTYTGVFNALCMIILIVIIIFEAKEYLKKKKENEKINPPIKKAIQRNAISFLSKHARKLN